VALRVGVVKAPGAWAPGDSRLVVVPRLTR
jgi:hypothetical protein